MAIRGRKPGTPKTGGRKRGSGNKQKLAFIREVSRAGITPLEHMLNVIRTPAPVQMNDESDEAYSARCKYHFARQDSMAASAAPYVHARLSSVDVKTPEPIKIESVDKIDIAKRVAFLLAQAIQR